MAAAETQMHNAATATDRFANETVLANERQALLTVANHSPGVVLTIKDAGH